MEPLFRLDCRPPWLSAQFFTPQRIASWSLNRPGLVDADQVVWLQVDDADLPRGADPLDMLTARLEAEGWPDAVGLMTARAIDHHHRTHAEMEGIGVEVLVTLGLSNGARLGTGGWPENHGGRPHAVGTINILVATSSPLTDGALLECISVAGMARTAALLADGGGIVGTGTDCIAVAAPRGTPGKNYAGLHTVLGRAVTAATWQAVTRAKAEWMGERQNRAS